MISYLFLPILLVDTICLIFRKYINIDITKNLISKYILLIFFFVAGVIATDIGFYLEFNSRINYIIFEYLDESVIMIKSVIFQFPYNLLFFIVIILFYLLTTKTKKLRLSMIYATNKSSTTLSFESLRYFLSHFL